MTLEIRNFLTISIGHVTEVTAKMLDSTPVIQWPTLGGPVGSYGWFFYAQDEQGDCPDDLMAIFTFARANNCTYVLLDCDADQIEELPYYDW